MEKIKKKVSCKRKHKYYKDWLNAFNLCSDFICGSITPSDLLRAKTFTAFLRNFRPLVDAEFVQFYQILHKMEEIWNFRCSGNDMFLYLSWLPSLITRKGTKINYLIAKNS
jgi:hypothetical protein